MSRSFKEERKAAVRARLTTVLVAVLVSLVLVADGYLACRFLSRMEKAETMSGLPCETVVISDSVGYGSRPANEGELATFSHDALRLEFDYPAEWGRIAISEQYGQSTWGAKVLTGLLLHVLPADGSEPLLIMQASNPNAGPVVDRRAYWGNRSLGISSLYDIWTWCGDMPNCEVYTNPHDLVVARQVMGEGGVPVYYLYNKFGGYNSVALSPELLMQKAGFPRVEMTFRSLVDSIRLIGR